MKSEARVFLGVTVFFIVIGIVYWFTSYEDAGSVMLAAAAVMGLVAGGAIWFVGRNTAPRAEDLPDATQADGAGIVDEFPTESIWPFAVGLSGAILASGFAFGAWLVIIGVATLALSLVGYIQEARYERNPDASGSGSGSAPGPDSGSDSTST